MLDIKIGQLWQEADNRFKRTVRVLEVDKDKITIITEADSYKAARKPIPTKARRDRFKAGVRSSHCGYFLVKDI